MYKRILVPLDGSEAAEKALPFVIEEAKLHNAKVKLIRVIAPLRPTLRGVPSIVDAAEEQLENFAVVYMDQIVKELGEKGTEVDCKIERGYPAIRILEYAKTSNCDLIILCTHGWTRALRWRFGSVANYIVRAKINIPVLIIPT